MTNSNCQQPTANSPLSTDLSGTWFFALDPDDKGMREQWFLKTLEQTIQLPGSVDAQGLGLPVGVDADWTGTIFDRSYFEDDNYAPYRAKNNIKVPFFLQPETRYKGMAWYQRTFEPGPEWDNLTCRLILERPHWQSRVWLNGIEVGQQDSLSTPHEFELGSLESGKTHRITVAIDNRLHIEVGENAHSVSDHTQGNWNGIIGSLQLSAVWQNRITKLDVFPDVQKRSIRVIGEVEGNADEVVLSVRPRNQTNPGSILTRQTIKVDRSNTVAGFEAEVELGANARLWDEFDPYLYELIAEFDGNLNSSVFGLREVSKEGSQLSINGRKVYLRGTLDCCIFPLTGHPPMDADSWHRVLQQIKAHGLNHVRFHSWCPPKAAFIAADELGIYLQVECPVWPNAVAVLAFNSPAGIGDGKAVDQWAYLESERILRAFGNHPSFVLMACGNEPGGPQHREFLSKWLEHFRGKDTRRLYSASAGWPELPENDFHIPSEPRLHQWGEGLESRLNAQAPATLHDYRTVITERAIPVISHEIGQWCAYPPLYDTSKYSGHLKARNYEIFADSLAANHMTDQLEDFVKASGKLQALCYKEEIEASLRTAGQAGFQLLGLQDFPGQQTAPVGMLDAFWESKGYLKADEMRRFCNETVPLVRLPKRVFSTAESVDIPLEIAHFGAGDLAAPKVSWQLSASRQPAALKGSIDVKDLKTGQLNTCGMIQLNWSHLSAPARYQLSVSIATPGKTFSNSWDLWLYPESLEIEAKDSLLVTSSLAEATEKLDTGASVLLIPESTTLSKQVELGFSPIFWNTACTQGQAPHTLGILCDPKHPALADFPTEFHSNWQWWYLIQNANALVIDALQPDCRPIVQVIDDWFKNRRLSLIFEARVGKGKLLLSSIDLLKANANPEQNLVCRQLLNSLCSYAQSPQFSPEHEITMAQLKTVLEG